jgi:integrase
MSVNAALRGYYEAKKGILSPSTAREYARSIERDFEDIKFMRTDKLTRATVQKWVSDYSVNHSAKSTRNAYGLLSAALDLMCDLRFKVELPKIPPRSYQIPSESDFRQALEECDSELKKAVLLAGIGTMRRGEIAALTYGDIDGNVIHVHADKIRSSDGYVIKSMPKTSASDRYITYPSFVIEALGTGKKTEPVVNISPEHISRRWRVIRKRCGLDGVRFHDLRHYAASIAHSLGVPDKVIQDRGGWSSDRVMKAVYRNTVKEYDDKFTDMLNEHFEKEIRHR